MSKQTLTAPTQGLVMSRGDCSPQLCCQRANLLHQAQFTDAYKLFSHQMVRILSSCSSSCPPLPQVSYSEFLAALRHHPSLLAECLAAGDRLLLPYMADIVATVFSRSGTLLILLLLLPLCFYFLIFSLLGSCVLPEDESVMMAVLHRLVKIQLLSHPNPRSAKLLLSHSLLLPLHRKLLRHGTSSFSRLYKSFSDQLFPARLFLTSALYDPILCLLTGQITSCFCSRYLLS